jgi:hypothetical protein
MNCVLYTSIIEIMKSSRLEWLGHIARMEDNVPWIKIKFSLPEISRKKGIPRLRWLDSVSKETKTLGVNACWKKQDIEMCGV